MAPPHPSSSSPSPSQQQQQQQQQPAFSSGVRLKKRDTPSTPRREIDALELQAVQSTASHDEADDNQRRPPSPPPRGSSLLERLVKEDRGARAANAPQPQPPMPSAARTRTRELDVLPEADTPPTSPPNEQQRHGSALGTSQRPAYRKQPSVKGPGDETVVRAATNKPPSPTRQRSHQQSRDDESFLGSMMRRARSNTASSLRPASRTQDHYDEDEAGRLALEEQHHDEESDHHDDGVVDYLDVVDPEVGVINHMSNIQSSIFLPSLSSLYDKRITHQLPQLGRRTSRASAAGTSGATAMEEGRAVSPTAGRRGSVPAGTAAVEAAPTLTKPPSMMRRASDAAMSIYKRKPAQAPQHIEPWEDMDEYQRHELDRHVEHLLSRPQKFRRGWRGFLIWARTPIGFIMLCYGLAITGWGIAICLFIFHWSTVTDSHERRLWIEYCDQVLCALFAAVGLGFAPFRAVDTYRMIHIAHYHHLSWRRRRQFNLPELNDPNDLPRPKGYNEAFPKPEERVMHLIAEEDDHHHEHNAGRDRGGSSSSSTNTTDSSSVPPPRPASASPTKRFAPPAANLPQAISNAKAVDSQTKRRWWRPWTTQREKEERQHAVEAAAKAVEEAPPVSDALRRLHSKNQGQNAPGAAAAATRPGTLERNASIMSEIVKEKEEVVVLTPEEQAKLSHHQRKFHKSHGYYRFHQTATHRAFPLDLMIVIVCLLDCHSLLQGCLGGVTWGIRYEHRPTALTASLISCSLSCNAVAGLIIYLGGRRTKKREEVERRLRIAMEEEAYKRIQDGVPLPHDHSRNQGGPHVNPLYKSAAPAPRALQQDGSRPSPIMEEATPSVTDNSSFSRPGSSRFQTTPATTPATGSDTKLRAFT